MVAGGSGTRFGTRKQYATIDGQRVLDRSVATARQVSHGVVVVVPAEDVAAEGGVAGGPTRHASVANGLAQVPAAADIVCVHDAARPLASAALFQAVIAAVGAGADGAVPGVAVTDTIKRVDGDVVVETLRRDQLVAVQTPQAFRAGILRQAHARHDGRSAEQAATDDAALVEALGGRVVIVPGEPANRKITHPDDLVWATQHLAGHAVVARP